MRSFGKFDLLASLARGGMAEVFLARQRGEGRFERLVVIKRILPHLADDPRFVELFLEEARIAALLDHPNIVPIYDFGRVADAYFIAMPYVHGLSVRRLIKQATKLSIPVSLEVATEIVRQALGGLAYAHERAGLDGHPLHLVHRDVSPSNLMVNEQGRVQLLDFGIASVADSSTTESGSLRGKIAYMSPEQVRADPLDDRSDLFSLGIVYWELLVGRSPFKRPSQMETMTAVTEGALPDPRQERPELPEPLVSFLLRALEQRRRRRFDSAAHMLAALDESAAALRLPTGEAVLKRLLREGFAELLDTQAQKVQEVQDTDDDEDVETIVDLPLPEAAPAAKPRRPRGLPLLVGLAAVVLLAACGLFLHVMLSGPVLDGPPLTIGLTPYLPEEVLRREWQPVVEHLEAKTRRPISVEVSLNYTDAAEALAASKVDVADLPAYPFILARKLDPGIQLLATPVRDEAVSYESYLVVRRGDRASKLADLAGRRVCLIDRTSASGYLMPRAVVRRAGHDPETFFSSVQMSGNHFRALQDLLAERCDVAAVTSSAYDTAEAEGLPAAKLRIVEVSPPIPHGVFCSSSKMPLPAADELRRAFLSFDVQRRLGRATLSEVLPITGFRQPDPTAFDELAREAP